MTSKQGNSSSTLPLLFFILFKLFLYLFVVSQIHKINVLEWSLVLVLEGLQSALSIIPKSGFANRRNLTSWGH